MLKEISHLHRELEACTRELSAALQQQAATADILKIISGSNIDLAQVLNALVATAARLCGATFGGIFLREGGRLRGGATIGLEAKDVAEFMDVMLPIDHTTVSGRVVMLGRVVNIPDIEADPNYDLAAIRPITSVRSMLGVPLLRDGGAEGAFFLGKPELDAFTDREIEFVQTFADEATIAIANVRLFRELKARSTELSEALQQQTATADVLKAISRSTFDLEAVLNTLVESAARLCNADITQIFRWDGDRLRWSAGFALSPEYLKIQKDRTYLPGRDSLVGRTALARQNISILDVRADPEYGYKDHAEVGKLRTLLGVPLLRSGELIGVIALARQYVEPYTDKQVELVTTFADQAVIAIENARLFEQVQSRTRDLQEALDHQTATSEVLNVISRSPAELQPVLDVIIETAVRLCEADSGTIARQQDGEFIRAGQYGFASAFREIMGPVEMTRGSITGRTLLEGEVVHILDAEADPEFTWTEGRKLGAIRTGLGVPLLRDGTAIGAIALVRRSVRPFKTSQIELVSTFADQAVIAMENARLFEEVRQRNRELTETLEQQTATSEILGVISSSPTNLQPVFDVLARNAARLSDAKMSVVYTFEGKLVHLVACHGMSEETFANARRYFPSPPDRKTAGARAILTGTVVEIPNTAEDPDYVRGVFDSNWKTGVLAVPMLRKGVPIGAIAVDRRQMGLFPKRLIDLLKTFADQAVIAIENAKLFEEVQARNRELTETLEQQTATSTILRVIAGSPTDIKPVLDTVAESAGRLCEAFDSVIFLKDGDRLAERAHYGAIPLDFTSRPIARDWVTGRAFIDRTPVHIPDLMKCASDYPLSHADAVRQGHRTILAVPLLREGEAIGALAIRRLEVRPFSQKQIELVTTFADQAAIAIENVRLFEQVEARTADLDRSVNELKALGEVSQAVNSSLDLNTVLETIVAKAVQLSGTDAGAIYVYSKSADKFRLKATYGMSAELIAAISEQSIALNDAGLGDAARQRAPVQMQDLGVSAATTLHRIVLAAGFRSVLVVPLLRPNKIVGALVVRRRRPGRFSDATVHLLETFATQSVLAIQNARLFSEIEEKSRQLEIASRHKSQFLANMSHELRTPLNSVLGFTEMLADGLYGDLPEKAKTTLGRVQANGRHLLGLINDVLDLSKIEAGQLTLSMETYSIGQIVSAVATATEPLARAKGLELSTTLAEGLPLGRGDERRLTQVLLNLAGNAVKFTDKGSITIAGCARDGAFELTVHDTGPGIASEHQKRIFEEFQQIDDSSTRQKGGTGLGLAISKRIIEMHGGRIAVDSVPGSGSTFRIVLPIKP